VTVQGPKIDGKVFNELQAGRMPDGTIVKDPDKRTPGWDLTASAPKSVSVMALVAGDARLVKAHRQASAAAAQYLERHAGTRVKVDGKAVHKHTGNLLIGRYTHDTSRAKDPALHDHLYVHNATYDASTGKWRAVDSTQLYQAKEAAGRLYSATLAQLVQSAGYKITETDKNGNFEIEGVPEQLIDRFSKRKAEIDAKVAESNDPNSRKARERAALLTRDAKTSAIETEAKREAWRKEAGKELTLIDRLRDAAARGRFWGVWRAAMTRLARAVAS
jgi:conjugative relaxase-like TrwC/TraI family protein